MNEVNEAKQVLEEEKRGCENIKEVGEEGRNLYLMLILAEDLLPFENLFLGKTKFRQIFFEYILKFFFILKPNWN